MTFRLYELAGQLGLQYQGDATQTITGVASLSSASSQDICFILNDCYMDQVRSSECATLIVPLNFKVESLDKSLIYAKLPQLSFVEAMRLLEAIPSKPNPHLKIHSSAQVSSRAIIAPDAQIGALVVIEDDVVVGSNSCIDAGCIVEAQSRIGDDCHLHSRVTVARATEIGDRCIFHSGVVLGSDGFGLIEQDQKWIKVPQIGAVIIGDDVEIGANTTIDRGALDNTIIEDGCKLDNLIQVAHNVHIGAHTAIAACVGIAGSAKIGKHCKISGAVSVLGHLSIADHVTVTAMSLVTKSIKNSGVYSSGTPLLENKMWHKNNARYKSLDGLAKSVKALDNRTTKLENK